MEEQRRLSRTRPAIDQSLADEREVTLKLKLTIHHILPYNEVEWARLQVMLSIYEGSDL